MERARFIKDELFEQSLHFLAVYMETNNSCLVLLSEKEDKLGTLAIAVPTSKDLIGPTSSSVLIGDRNAVTARMFAEYVATKKQKIALVSIYLETVSELQGQQFFKKLVERVIGTETEKVGTVT
jgi:hypothetical protein